jgi:hypothetical protein
MKTTPLIALLLLCSLSPSFSQQREYRVHQRGMLHQTVYNTGEVGRAYDAGQSGIPGGDPPSMEWPPNSHMFVDRKEYAGQHNSFGGGLYLAATRGGQRLFAFCGAVSTTNGQTTPVEGVFSYPVSIERRENYPVLGDGNLNPAYNPDEAEEIITSKWGTSTGITVTRTSRAWSFPGYDDFIIYEYEIQNTTPDTLRDVFVVWGYGISTSMFGYERKFNRWAEADFRNRDHFARFDLKRYLSYGHERDAKPDTVLFNSWSAPGDRGGLNSPQAAGIMFLHYDYDHLAVRGETDLYVSSDDAKVVWDENNKIKQPYCLRYENGNLYYTKLQQWVDYQARKVSPFRGTTDSLNFPDNNYYWIGRVKPSYKLSPAQPANRGYGFAPYLLLPNDVARFTLAEVVGYGPGVAGDSVYRDLGGSTMGSTEPGSGMHPVPSWYNTLSYPEIANPSLIGSTYLQTHPVPWYVDKDVVSIRDVADRAIQIYIGGPVVKYDSVQFEPKTTPVTGRYQVPIPVPAPVIRVENTAAASNRITWGPQVESFTTPRLRAPFSHYQVMRSTHPLGPWTVVDSVGKRDPRYFRENAYVLTDAQSNLGIDYYYAVLSVDALGGKSGMTNLTQHTTQAPADSILTKVYVVPNPLVVTNGRTGSAQGGEVTDQIGFFGLTRRCTIKIFSFSGQLVQTIEHNANEYANVTWFQISRNQQMIASGVYFFVVQDGETGKWVRGKFVILH